MCHELEAARHFSQGDNENPFIVIGLKNVSHYMCMFDNKFFYCPGRKSKVFCALNNIFTFVGARSGFSCFMINGLIIIVILVVVAINVFSLRPQLNEKARFVTGKAL